MPEVIIEDPYAPSTYHGQEMTTRVMGAIANALGQDHVYERPPSMGGEDFSQFARTDENIPALIFWTGAADPVAMKLAKEGKAASPPANHSPFFAPQAEPALKNGVEAITVGALELLGKP